MKLDRKFRPELVCSTDETRSISQCALDVPDTGGPASIVATDGHMLVRVPCMLEEGDTPGPVSADVLTLARKLAVKSRATETRVEANGCYKLADGTSKPREDRGQFPPWQQIVPSFEDEETITFGLDADLLATLQKALGSSCVKLTFRIPRKSGDGIHEQMLAPILVNDGSHGTDAFGVLMPCRV